jgi:hypothetical protein
MMLAMPERWYPNRLMAPALVIRAYFLGQR